MNLVPLFEEALEFQDYNGTVLSDGKVAVYYIGRTRLADIYEDVAAEYPAENPRILNNLGMGPVYVNPAFDYEMVVFDAYGSELFSVKKYLASKGEHSTANVVVTPSESIAVSAWTVGDVQVYMPYLTGQLGKVYTGIDPIVVNNVEDKISANHVPLGVQDPLYFVQDDEEGCIIGFSGETIPEGTMNESAFGYEDGQITSYNGSAFSAGNTYEAGSFIDIDGNTISVTGLQPSGEYVTSGDLDEYTKRTDFDAAISSLNSAKLDVDVYSSQSANFLTAHQSLEGYATEQWVENKGYLTAVPDNYATTGDLQTVSGDITAMIPSTAGLATENWVTSQGYLTAHQSLSGLMSANLLEISDNKITGYNGTAFAGQGGGVIGDYELSAGSGISIVDYPLEQKTVISVTAQGGNPEVEHAVIDNSATWDSVTSKLDTTAAYTPEFAYHDTAISSIDNSALYDNSAHARINTLAGRISDLSSNKLDTTAFSDVSGTFLTAHQDLSDYQTTAGMTAYQPAGDYLTTADSAEFYTTANESGFITGVDLTPYQLTADMTAYQPVGDYLTTGDSANFYTTANESGYITAIPDTYLQNTDLTITDNKVTEISGVPLSAGTELEFEYDAADNISAINNSAISTTPSQALYAQNPLYFSATGTSSYMGINTADLARMLGVDETELWTGTVTATGIAIDLNDSLTNFNKVKFILTMDSTNYEYIDADASRNLYTVSFQNASNNDVYLQWMRISANNDKTKMTIKNSKAVAWPGSTTALNPTAAYVNWEWTVRALTKIVGIGRKEV